MGVCKSIHYPQHGKSQPLQKWIWGGLRLAEIPQRLLERGERGYPLQDVRNCASFPYERCPLLPWFPLENQGTSAHDRWPFRPCPSIGYFTFPPFTSFTAWPALLCSGNLQSPSGREGSHSLMSLLAWGKGASQFTFFFKFRILSDRLFACILSGALLMNG